MKAGRELDALVAEKVMGKKVVWHGQNLFVLEESKYHALQLCAPDYSTDIAAAWEVVEKLKDRGCIVHVIFEEQWCADFFTDAPGGEPTWSYADTAPLAICLAALKAVGVEVKA